MNIVFFGDCEKHDFVLTTAIALQTVNEEVPVTVVSDNDRNYRFFEGEVSGISIAKPGSVVEKGIVIYDCHKTILCDDEEKTLILASDYSKASVELTRRMFNSIKFDGLILAEQESSISRKYFDTYIGGVPIYTYSDSSSRRIDCVFNGRVKIKGMEEDFLKAVGKFLSSHCNVDSKDIKNLWAHLKRRG